MRPPTPTRLAAAATVALLRGPHDGGSAADLARAVGGRTVMVTGASAGIGRAVALRCGRAGARVLLVARRQDALDEVADRIAAEGGIAHVHPCDLADQADLDRTADAVLGAHGRVDVLVNNAGRSIRRPVVRSLDRFHDVERTVRLNYLAAVRLIHRVLPGMLGAGDGHVVNLSTMALAATAPRFAAYLGSKAALDAYSRAMALEVAGQGIAVTTVHMPLVQTGMIAPTEAYRRAPALTADQAAAMVTRALVDRPARVMPPAGHVLEALDAVVPHAVRRAALRARAQLRR